MPRTQPRCELRPSPIPSVAYAAYMTHLFLLSPTGPIDPLDTLREAAQLSLNFAYVTPLVLPSLAPALHPMLEAIFNLVVAWALLFVCFISEDLAPPPTEDVLDVRVPATPFLLFVPFLTNIFYLPYLALRSAPTSKLVAIPRAQRTSLQRFADSSALPLLSAAMGLASVPWALFARPEFGDVAQRWESFTHLFQTDILAHSFAVDLLVFAVFQSWMVADDVRRRVWEGDVGGGGRVPFVGLVVYLLERASRAQVRWAEEDEILQEAEVADE